MASLTWAGTLRFLGDELTFRAPRGRHVVEDLGYTLEWKKGSFRLRSASGKLVKASVVDYVPLLENDGSAYTAVQEEKDHEDDEVEEEEKTAHGLVAATMLED